MCSVLAAATERGIRRGRREAPARRDRGTDAGERFFRGRAHQGGIAERKAMIDRAHDLPIAKQAEVLRISRGSVYDLPRPVSEADLAIMRRLDRLHGRQGRLAGRRVRRAAVAPRQIRGGVSARLVSARLRQRVRGPHSDPAASTSTMQGDRMRALTTPRPIKPTSSRCPCLAAPIQQRLHLSRRKTGPDNRDHLRRRRQCGLFTLLSAKRSLDSITRVYRVDPVRTDADRRPLRCLSPTDALLSPRYFGGMIGSKRHASRFGPVCRVV